MQNKTKGQSLKESVNPLEGMEVNGDETRWNRKRIDAGDAFI
jgi:hypothetical protein